MKKLAGVEAPLANFFASGVLALGAKLGPVLWQLPPTLGYDAERLAAFFAQLPRSTGAAAELASPARRADGGPGAARPPPPTGRCGTRWRSGTAQFATAGFVELLREHDIALVVADTAGKWPTLPTSPPTSSTSGCTATRSSTSAGTTRRRWTGGRPGSAPGPPAAPRPTGPCWPRRPRGSPGTSSSTSTTTSRCGHRSTRSRWPTGSASRRRTTRTRRPAGPGDVAEEARHRRGRGSDRLPARGTGRGESQARRRRR